MDKRNIITTVVFFLPVFVIAGLIISSPAQKGNDRPVAQLSGEAKQKRVSALQEERARISARLDQVMAMNQEQWVQEGIEWAKQGKSRAPNLEAARAFNKQKLAEIDRDLEVLKAKN